MRIEELEREVRAERAAPEPDFARRLDEWAAAGFPRDAGLGPRSLVPRGAGAMRAPGSDSRRCRRGACSRRRDRWPRCSW